MKKIKNNKIIKPSIIVIVILTIVTILTPILANNLKFGLDLQGGFEVLYQVESIDGSDVTNDMVTSTYKTLIKRIDILGVSEPVITIEGTKVRVQLAGVTSSEEAKSLLSAAASLTFRDTDDNLLMNSDVLKSGGAKVSQDSSGNPAVSLSVADKDQFYKITKQISESDDNRIVIWLDFNEENGFSTTSDGNLCGTSGSTCLSSATVSQGFASDVIIQGDFSSDEVSELVDLINSGSLPTKLTEVSSKTVAASFGSDSLEKTVTAGAIAILVIIALMIYLYRFAGFVASVGIVIYTFLTFGLFWLVGGVLTLPGIAATVLGIGMAIDANIINFSKIKDELEDGHDFKTAYRRGNANSLMTVIDANVTTLLVGIILFILGESSVKGFATMLIINIIVTIIAMVIITRLLLNAFVNTNKFNKHLKFFLGINKNKLGKKKFYEKFEFVKSSRIFISISVIVIILGIVSISFSGLNLGVDFKGGSSITIKSANELVLNDIKNDVEKLNYDITTIETINSKTIDLKISDKLTEEQIASTEQYFEEKYEATTDIGVISDVVRNELIKNAILSLVLASIGIIIYMSIRYKFSYAVGGVVALLHDAFIIIALFSIFKIEISSIFIAAILTIIGYSINDTIVIFDRIKETITKEYKNNIYDKQQLVDAVNYSLRKTLARSIITTTATLIPVIFLIILGSNEILNFNIALLFGLIAGSYSSIFIASQIWLKIEEKQIGKPKRKKWYEENELEEKRIKGIND
ncbi:MAG: protein translocase subunit SecF [Bacilli bacterium]